MKLSKKVAIVTGGSQGIGEAIARRFAAEGAIVAVVASSDIGKASVVVDRIATQGGAAKAYVCDVRDACDVNALLTDVGRDIGQVDIVVNCAGVFYQTPAGATDVKDFDRMVDSNVRGTWNVINATVPTFKAQGGGTIVSMASIAAVMGMANYAPYCATKAAVMMMTRALACELAPFNIKINCIAPGNTATPMNENIRTEPAFANLLEGMRARTPSGRTYSSVDDMASIALFLACDDSRAMHGACVLADEGLSAGLMV